MRPAPRVHAERRGAGCHLGVQADVVIALSSDELWGNLTEGEVAEITQAALQAAETKNPRAMPTKAEQFDNRHGFIIAVGRKKLRTTSLWSSR